MKTSFKLLDFLTFLLHFQKILYDKRGWMFENKIGVENHPCQYAWKWCTSEKHIFNDAG